jgi:N-acyl-D-amino-acid deacylase
MPVPIFALRPFDLLLRGGSVVDGTGAPPFAATVGVRDGRIAFVGPAPESARAVHEIAATGCCISPGFIDIHTHSDISVLYTPGMDSSLAQGVTTEVVGNCGFSLGLSGRGEYFAAERRGLERAGLTLDWDDLDAFFRRIEDQGVAINLTSLAGHGTLRKRAMGVANRAPDAVELLTMQRDLAAALGDGAIGLSSGLEYVPGMYADVTEMTTLARIAADAGGFYATHLRDEGDYLIEAVTEAISVAEGAGLPLQLSHHKAERPRNWEKIAETLALVDAAEARGMNILLDQYPYTAYQTGLATIALPPWAMAGTPQALAETLRDPATRARVRAAMPDLDWRAVEVASSPDRREEQGRTVADLAEESGKEPREWLLDRFSVGESFLSAAHFAISEADVERIMRDPRVMVGSDAVAISPTGPAAVDRPHPRSYGTFARILSRYVREKGVLSLEEAIRKMTSLPASRIGLADRGVLSPGKIADIAVFSPGEIDDIATFANPHRLAVGIRLVVVAGEIAFRDGIATGARAGRVLRQSKRL